MAINKIVPLYLNKSDDQRLVKQIEMTNASNVRVSSDDTGNNGVVKNIKGTIPVAPQGLVDRFPVNTNLQVVGSISIPKKQWVIFFVYVDTESSTPHGIYLYDVSADNYYLLIGSSLLNFQAGNYIDVSATYNEDDELLVYFTDNYNPPRKINVDRLIANADQIWADSNSVGYYTDTDRLEFLEVCKTPPLDPITFTYNTDTNISKNNLIDKVFQFTYQYIYEDGEVSALAPYSKLAFSPTAFGSSIINPDQEKENNRIVLSYQPGNQEVKKVRILARDVSGVSFVKIAEKDNPYPSTGIHNFTNDGLFPYVSSSDQEKLYDNVPQKAGAQTIAGNRLAYGDYTEGYDNITPIVVSSVEYKDREASGAITVTLNQPASGDPAHFIIDGSSLGASYIAGSLIIVKFQVVGGATDCKLNIYNQTSNQNGYIPIWSTTFLHGGSDSYVVSFGHRQGNYSNATYLEVAFPLSRIFNIGLVTSTTTTRNQILDALAANLSANEIVYDWENTGPYYNAYGEVTSPTSASAHSLGDAIVAPVSFSNVTLDLTTDQSYSVTNKRKVDIEITDLDIEYVITSGTDEITLLLDQGTELEQASSVSITPTIDNIYYKNYENITFTMVEGLAYSPGYNSFKSSALHNFGIVYYDKKGRSSAVQKLNGVYVAGYAETARNGKTGGVQINLEIRHNPPSWATKYQIVYGGNENYDDFIQYSVAGAHYLADDALEGDQQLIYLDLMPLEGKNNSYSKDKGSNLEYTFSEGDVLRIISYKDSTQTVQYLDGYEFLVVKKEVVTDTSTLANNSVLSTGRTGTFVVVRNEDYAYKAVDKWNISSVRAETDYWGQSVVVEICSPKRVKNEVVYYEMSHVYNITNGEHIGDDNSGAYPVVHLVNGDVTFKPRTILFPPWDSNNSTYDAYDYEEYDYEVVYVESQSISDFFDSTALNRGRPHGINPEAKQIRRRSSITYSDAYAIDSDRLYLSSFNLGNANYIDLDVRHGKIDKLIDQTERLIILQEHKAGMAGINRNILETLTGGDVVASNVFIGTPSYYAGDFGSSGYPAAVVTRFGITYYVDVKSQRVIRLSNDGITPISDKSMQNYFDGQFATYLAQDNKTELDIVGGFDPDHDEYLLTAKPLGNFGGFTISYGHKEGQWLSLFSFVPDLYDNINDKLLSYKSAYSSIQRLLWKHEDASAYNTFYTTSYPSSITVVANYNPSLVKTFDAISLEGTHAWSATLETSNQQTTIADTEFLEKENEFFANVPRSTTNSKENYVFLGTVDSVSNTAVTFKERINQQPLPIDAKVYEYDGSTFTDLGSRLESIGSSKVATFNNSMSSVTPGNRLVLILSAKEEGDKLRDYYCSITLSNDTYDERVELFAVNVSITRSTLHSELSQQPVNQ